MSFTTNFRLIRRFLAPRWLLEGDGGLVGYALDVIKDEFVERVYLGLLARLPQNDSTGDVTAPSDALAAMGRDRRVVRGINETDVSYAARLIAWLDDRKTAGNPFALMQKLSEYTGNTGCSFRTVDAAGNWYSRAVDGTRSLKIAQANWNWDSSISATQWSRFWVIIYPGTLWTQGQEWGNGATQDWGDDGHTWGSTATPDQIATVKFIVNDWKPAGTKCVNIILAFDSASFDPTAPEPDGLWGHWSKVVAGVQVPARLSTARYIDGA